MPTTLALFALCALFTTGSAQELPPACVSGDTNTKSCFVNGYIGTCNEAACEVASTCTGDDTGDACGATSGTNPWLKGTCEVAEGKCKYTTECSTGDTISKTCRVGEFLGKCTGAVCGGVDNYCQSSAKDAACGVLTGSVASLKGKCETQNGKCKHTIDCATGDTNTKFCNASDEIGTCSGTSCVVATFCANKDKDVPCGNLLDSVAKLKGSCVADGGKCEYTKSVMVSYTVSANLSNKTKVQNGLKAMSFMTDLTTRLGRTVGSSGLFCAARTHPVANGTLTCEQFSRDKCTLACTGNAKEVEAATRKCDTSGAWVGTAGRCASSCPKLGTDDNMYVKKVTNGTVTCESRLDGTKCKLVCDNPTLQHPDPDTALVCAGTIWTGVEGSCMETLLFSASAQVRLSASDDYTNTVDKKNDDFNDKFKQAVAEQLGVGAIHIFIVNIKSVSGDRRRLNEASVQVDYTIDLTERDPEGAAVEGGLRGIR